MKARAVSAAQAGSTLEFLPHFQTIVSLRLVWQAEKPVYCVASNIVLIAVFTSFAAR